MKNTLIFLTYISIFAAFFLFLASCTFSINIVHSQGKASDLIDEELKNDPDITPNFDLPAL